MDSISLTRSLNLIGNSDGPTSIFLAGKMYIGYIAALIVIGLVLCFFGLKLMKLVATLLGFLIGASAGAGISGMIGIQGVGMVAITIVCGILLAVLSFFVYRIGVFVMAFLCVMGAILTIFENPTTVILIIAVVVALILAVLAAVFVEPVIIVITGAFGGLLAGVMILTLADLSLPLWAGYVVGAVIAVIGIMVQFALHSRKIRKQEKLKSEQIKEADSMENEVEKARMILDDDDEEE